MNHIFAFKPFRLPIAGLVISQLLLGYVGPSKAQAPSEDLFAPLEEPLPSNTPQPAPPRINEPRIPGQEVTPVPGEITNPPTLPLPPVNNNPITPADSVPEYIIGPGDSLRFDVFNVPELTNDESGNRLVADNVYRVLVDGTISLPWIGSVYVEGLTLEGAAAAVALEYEEFIFDPVVSFSLFSARPTRVAVVGEVNRPGAYTTREEGAASTEVSVAELRTVAQAIQNAGGITQLADIRNIELIRPEPDGTQNIVPIDFYALLVEGDQSQNALLRDGDTVMVPRATALTPEEARALATANFSPDVIGVDVVGEIDAPGRVEIEPNSTLNQAILAAGGFDDPRAKTGEVTLIRINPNGTVENRTIPVDLAAGINEETNPPLQDNDIVIVSRSGITETADILELIGTAASSVVNPILGVFGIINILDNLGDDDNDNN